MNQGKGNDSFRISFNDRESTLTFLREQDTIAKKNEPTAVIFQNIRAPPPTVASLLFAGIRRLRGAADALIVALHDKLFTGTYTRVYRAGAHAKRLNYGSARTRREKK